MESKIKDRYGDFTASAEHALIGETPISGIENTASHQQVASSVYAELVSTETLIEQNRRSSADLIRLLQKTKTKIDQKSNTVDRLKTQSSIIKYGTTDNKDKAIIERDEAIIKKETDLTETE